MKTAKTIFLATLLAVGLACGYSSHGTTPPGAGTTPNIVSLSPNSTIAGTTKVMLTVMGTNFNSNATINWNGTALATSRNGANLTTTIPDADTASKGSATVNVTNPGTSGGAYGGGTLPETSNSMTFTIN
jgi:hypothetical protein